MKASTAAGDPSPPPPSPPPRRWISGLVSGASRILAAVLDPESSASDTTSSSPDSSQSPPRRDQPAADHGIGKCFPSDSHQLNLSGKEIILKDSGEGSLAIVSEIDPKDAVKQLLMQETYSRSECDALIKLIQERVVDPDDEPAVILPIAWHANTQQHPVAYSSSPDTAIPAVSDPAYCPVFDNNVEKKCLKKRSDVAEGPCTNSHDRIQRAVKRSYSPGDFFEDARRMPKRNKSDSLRNHGGAAAQHFTSTSCQADWDKCGSGMSYPYSSRNQQKMSRVKAEVVLDGPVPLEIDMTHLEQKNTLTVRNGSCSVSNKTVLQGDIEAAPSSSMGLQTEKSSRNCSRGFNLQSSIPTKTRSAARRTRRSNNGKTVRPCNEPPQQRNPMAGQESDKGRVQAKRPAGRPRKEWK